VVVKEGRELFEDDLLELQDQKLDGMLILELHSKERLEILSD